MRLRDESGQAMVMTALAFSVLLGFASLAVDTGVVFHAKRNLQIAADAGATAGALDYLYNASTTSAQSVAGAASTSNGFTDGSSDVTVTVNVPSASGPNSGVAGTVEVIVSKKVPTTFMTLFGFPKMTVKARAVAATPSTGTACIWLMDPTSTDLYTQGSYDIEAPGCGVYMNSTSKSAVSVTGNGGTLNALFADAVGGSIGHQTSPTSINTYTAPRTNPWGNITGPTPTITTTTTGKGKNQTTTTTVTWTGCDYVDNTTTTLGSTSSTTTYNTPGTGIAGAGKVMCYSNPITIDNATFGSCSSGCSTIAGESISQAAGTIAFAQGVTIPTGSTVSVYGGTIDIASGTFTQASNVPLSVVAPTSGTYNGVAIMQPKTNTNQLQVQKGSNNQVLDGYIYAPGAQVYIQDSGGGVTATGIVADNMSVQTGQLTIPSYDKAHPTTTPNRVLTLVE